MYFLANTAKFKLNQFMKNRKGASNVEIIVWISVVLVIATVLFLFRDSVGDFIDRAGSEIDGLDVK